MRLKNNVELISSLLWLIIFFFSRKVASTAIVSLSPPLDATIPPTADTFEIQFDQKVHKYFLYFAITSYIFNTIPTKAHEMLNLLELGSKYLTITFKYLRKCYGKKPFWDITKRRELILNFGLKHHVGTVEEQAKVALSPLPPQKKYIFFNDSSSKKMTNAFYFILKTFFFSSYLNFCLEFLVM